MTKEMFEPRALPSPRLKSRKTSWGVLYSIAALLASVVAIYTLISYSTFEFPYTISTKTSESLHRPALRLKPVVNSQSQDAEELLVGSLTLLNELLVKINNDVKDSDGSATTSRPLLARGFLTDITSLFSSMSGGKSPTGGKISDASLYLGAGLGNGTLMGLSLSPSLLQKNKAALPPPTGINSVAQSLGRGLTSSVVGSVNISSIMPSVDIVGASRALSGGIGSGAAGGLNLKALNTSMYNTTDVPGIAGSFGQGLTYGFLNGVDVKALAASMGGMVNPEQTKLAALALAEGLGGGAAFASKLTTTPPSGNYGSDTVSGVAGNFGQGLSTSFLQDVDLMQIAAMMKPNLSPAQVREAASGFASGLGGGAAFGIKLSTTPPSNDVNPDGIGGLANSVGSGLSVSFLQNINFKQLAANAASAAPPISRQQMLEAAQGFGSGLAGGTVVGIGLQPDSNTPVQDDGGVGPITDTFARSLTRSFLANGNALKLASIVMQTQGSAPKIDMRAVARGFAVGLVDGAQTSIDNAGGVQKIFSIKSTEAGMMAFPAPMTDVDDGVGGAAFGFGNGLSSEAVKGVLQVFGNPPIKDNAPAAPVAGMSSLDSPSPAPITSMPGTSMDSTTPGNSSAARLIKRQLTADMSPGTSSVSIFANNDTLLDLNQLNITLGPYLQKGSNLLGCQGVGGLIAVVVSAGLNSNLTTGMTKTTSDLKTVQAMLQKFTFLDQTFTIQDQNGNTIKINLGRFILLINENSVVTEILTLTGHITIAIITFAIVIPAILIIHSIHSFAVMTGRNNILTKASKIQWGLALFVVLPSLIGILVLGVLSVGKRGHFYSLHGILGLLLTLFTLTAFPLAYFRSDSNLISAVFKANLALILSLTFVELTSGFNDLSVITSCALQFLPQFLFVSVGFMLAAPILQATTLLILETIITRWRRGAPDAYIDDEKDNLKMDSSPQRSFMNI